MAPLRAIVPRVRVAPALAEALAEAERRAREARPGERVTQADVIRDLLAEALRARGIALAVVAA